LSSLMNLKDIAEGKSKNGVVWEISFSNDGAEYFWSGEFELIESIKRRSLIKETVQLNGQEIEKKVKMKYFLRIGKCQNFTL